MRGSGKLPELLAPAGSFEVLLAAVAAGADAIYVGGKSFGARAYAKNFDIDEMKMAVRYCHLHGVKLYVTVNTLVEDKEMAALSDYAKELYTIGVDAIICADLGAIAEIRRRVPKLEIHASTQMSVHNTDGADAAVSLGCTRVVPARELSLENIKSIVDNSKAEVEIFLHGALCVCHSGQCLFSSLVGGRSGNRGECAQPCRLPYNGGKYPLSLKDLSLSAHIPEIIESGVCSVKIEGRMKSAEYVYTVTSIYRRLFDEHRCATRDEERRLREAFSRDGFTDGYFTKKLGGMTGVRTEKDKEISRMQAAVDTQIKRCKIKAEITLLAAERSALTLYNENKRVCVYGEVPVAAINAPLTEDGVRARISKMGNTYLSLDPEDIEITLAPGINLPPSALNALRRDAAERFESCDRELAEKDTPYTGGKRISNKKPYRSMQIFNVDLYNSALSTAPDIFSDFDLVFIPLMQIDRACGAPVGVSIPPVIFDTEWHLVEKMLEKARDIGVKVALVGNIGHIERVKSYGFSVMGDFRLNVMNGGTYEEYIGMGLSDVIVSPELTLPMARDIGGALTVYGKIPLMVTERCFMKDSFGCDNCSKCQLIDRTGAKFPMMREFDHRNIIFNSTPTYMGDKRDELTRAKISGEHFIFSDESARTLVDVLRKYKRGEPLGAQIRRIGKRKST